MRNALCVCCLIGCFLRPSILLAQAKLVVGWGPYLLGKTTPDSLYKTGFREQPQPLVKGTIALPCSHLRVFQADMVHLDNLVVTNLSLVFYDNTLFKIDCDGTALVRRTFSANYGKGIIQPLRTIKLCETGKRMTIAQEVWQQEGRSAFFVRAEGYTTECQPAAFQKLVIVDQRFLALTSECDLKDEYIITIER